MSERMHLPPRWRNAPPIEALGDRKKEKGEGGGGSLSERRSTAPPAEAAAATDKARSEIDGSERGTEGGESPLNRRLRRRERISSHADGKLGRWRYPLAGAALRLSRHFKTNDMCGIICIIPKLSQSVCHPVTSTRSRTGRRSVSQPHRPAVFQWSDPECGLWEFRC